MKSKNFNDYLKKRLSKSEIKEIQQQADIEHQALNSLQQDISKAVSSYIKKEKIGFNELVRRLCVSPSKLAKIQKGEANLTLASLAHIAALLKKRPHIIFKEK